MMELVNYNELMYDLALHRGYISTRKSAEQFKISASRTFKTGFRGHYLIETGSLAKMLMVLMSREGGSVIRAGRPPRALHSRSEGFIVPLLASNRGLKKQATWHQAAKFIRKYWKTIREPDDPSSEDHPKFIASWFHNGKSSIHVANVVLDYDEAIDIAFQRKLESIYDFAAKKVIQL